VTSSRTSAMTKSEEAASRHEAKCQALSDYDAAMESAKAAYYAAIYDAAIKSEAVYNAAMESAKAAYHAAIYDAAMKLNEAIYQAAIK